MKKISNFFKRNYKSLIVSALMLPPVLISIVSTVHIISWYGLTNIISWAVFLAIAVEVAALSTIAAIAAKDFPRNSLYAIFIIVTFLQVIGNIYYSYDFVSNMILVNPSWMTTWQELTAPIIDLAFDSEDIITNKIIISTIAGGALPVISLLFLHMLVNILPTLRDPLAIEKEGLTELTDDTHKLVEEVEELVDEIHEMVDDQANDQVEDDSQTDSQVDSQDEETKDEVKEEESDVKKKENPKNSNINSENVNKAINRYYQAHNVGMKGGGSMAPLHRRVRSNNPNYLGRRF